jgi:alpha-tubulin suppressor-like RCC1 family protein
VLGNGTASGPDTCGSEPCSTTPVAVQGLTGATAVSIDDDFACALLSGGTVECWGANSVGELGNGTTTAPDTCIFGNLSGASCYPTPVAVGGLKGATAISVGGVACALLSGGTVECWGDNELGQLGNGTTTNSSTPVAVSGITDATAISVGDDSACALLSGSTVQCWGSNNYGELGNGTTTNSTTPVAVSGLTGATGISVGNDSACALLSGGSVQCWGLNAYGQLGNGTTTNSSTPVAVTGLTGAVAVSAGDSACALLSDGTVQCWGLNQDGSLGNGTTTGPDNCGGAACSMTPVAVTGLTGVAAISVGASPCALLSGGTVQCWGWNLYGQLGIGTTTGPETYCDALRSVSDGGALLGSDGGCLAGTIEPFSTTPVTVQ